MSFWLKITSGNFFHHLTASACLWTQRSHKALQHCLSFTLKTWPSSCFSLCSKSEIIIQQILCFSKLYKILCCSIMSINRFVSQVLPPGPVWALHRRHRHLPGGLHLQSELHKEPVLDRQAGGGALCHQPSRAAAHPTLLRDDGEPSAGCQSARSCPHEVLHG